MGQAVNLLKPLNNEGGFIITALVWLGTAVIGALGAAGVPAGLAILGGMAAMAGALNVQLEKPGQYILGDNNEELTPKKILTALKIRNLTILLFILFMLPIIWFVRLFIFPF